MLKVRNSYEYETNFRCVLLARKQFHFFKPLGLREDKRQAKASIRVIAKDKSHLLEDTEFEDIKNDLSSNPISHKYTDEVYVGDFEDPSLDQFLEEILNDRENEVFVPKRKMRKRKNKMESPRAAFYMEEEPLNKPSFNANNSPEK